MENGLGYTTIIVLGVNMKSRIRLVGLVASALILCTTGSNATDIYTTAENPTSTGGISDVAAVDQAAQTFTALEGGELATISVALWKNGPVLPAEVLVDFRLTSGGLPGPIVATASIPSNAIGTPAYPYNETADFSSYHISLSAGSVYAFSLRAPNGDPGHAYAGGSGDIYPGGGSYYSLDSGNSWLEQTGYDLTFAVTAVPEPSIAAFAGLAVLVLVLTCRTTARSIYCRYHACR